MVRLARLGRPITCSIDDEAVPTVVEVKRSTNSQLRREVVGQLLEYVANLRASTSADDLRSVYEQTVLARRARATRAGRRTKTSLNGVWAVRKNAPPADRPQWLL